jgi:RRG7 (Required for Respiratory Growth 7) protein
MRLAQIHRFPERFLSTVQRGTAFEYRALALLTKHMSMSLTHVGGSYDGGVDLIGWWWVPRANHTTRACRV